MTSKQFSRRQTRGIATRLGLHLCSVGRLEESAPQAKIFELSLHCSHCSDSVLCSTSSAREQC